MYRRWFEMLWIFMLVVVVPPALASIMPGKDMSPIQIEQTEGNTQEAESTTVPNAEPIKKVTVAVLNNGVVENMDLETYVFHVVLAEMPATFEVDALKAQAVVARTYTMRRKQGTAKHETAVVCTDSTCCQAYKTATAYLANGGTQTELERVKKAVKDTKGEVLLYGGQLIEATYFSCSGGMTEDAKAVWGQDIPYLVSTKSPGEEGATHFVDTAYFTKKEFEKILGCDISGSPDVWLGDTTYTKGQGVDTIQIGGKAYKGTDIRKLLGLRSTAFVISAIGDTIVITTKGYGHRVGMSQYGADAMAVSGSNYRQILAHYYAGTTLSTLID